MTETFLRSWLFWLTLAPFIGSFLGVLVVRLPANRPVVAARSRCETCNVRLAPRDLVPLFSYAALRGRCRYCMGKISRRHLYIELAAMGIVLVAAVAEPYPQYLWMDCGLGWTLLALGLIDLRSMRLPDVLTLPLIPAGLVITLLRAPDYVLDHTVAAILGYASFRVISLAYRALRARDGLGQGDAKLLAAAGAWVGVVQLADVALAAAVVTLVVLVAKSWRGQSFNAAMAVPFGPGLCLALWMIWICGLG